MDVRMESDERCLFENVLKCASSYLEFGAGGSTCLAASTSLSSIISVDSSRDWLDRVQSACKGFAASERLKLVHVDIGELGEWGAPKNHLRRSSWPLYHSSVWSEPETNNVDLFMVDGRFRVACFIQCLLHGRSDSLIVIHDFADREYYHHVRRVAREVARARNLSVFIKPRDFDPQAARKLLADHSYDPR